jgi:hypothetical protein
MTAFRKLAVPAAALLLAQGACAREGDLSGEMFIATKGGENVKLGLVEVRAIPEEVMKAHIGRKRTAAQQALASVRSDYERALNARTEAESTVRAIEQSDTVKKNLDAWLYLDLQNPGGVVTDWGDATPALKNWQAARVRLKKANNDWSPWSDRTSRWTSVEYYLSDLPAGEQVAKTDADGRFSMRLDRNKRYALAAKSSRQIGDETETYRWLTWVSLDGKASGRIMLSNDNLADVDHPRAVVSNKDRERP